MPVLYYVFLEYLVNIQAKAIKVVTFRKVHLGKIWYDMSLFWSKRASYAGQQHNAPAVNFVPRSHFYVTA